MSNTGEMINFDNNVRGNKKKFEDGDGKMAAIKKKYHKSQPEAGCSSWFEGFRGFETNRDFIIPNKTNNDSKVTGFETNTDFMIPKRTNTDSKVKEPPVPKTASEVLDATPWSGRLLIKPLKPRLSPVKVEKSLAEKLKYYEAPHIGIYELPTFQHAETPAPIAYTGDHSASLNHSLAPNPEPPNIIIQNNLYLENKNLNAPNDDNTPPPLVIDESPHLENPELRGEYLKGLQPSPLTYPTSSFQPPLPTPNIEAQNLKTNNKESRDGVTHPLSLKFNEETSANSAAAKGNNFVCDFYNYSTIIEKHINRMNSVMQPFSCMLCSFRCSDPIALKNHFGSHSTQNSFICSICRMGFLQLCELEQHLKDHKQKLLKCSLCDFKSADAFEMTSHMMEHSRLVEGYSCKVCNEKFYNEISFENHKQTHIPQQYCCAMCGYKCGDSFTFTYHVQCHTQAKKFCERLECLHPTPLKPNPPKNPPLSCEFCDYKCYKKNLLNSHIKRHYREQSFCCTVCGYKSNVLKEINLHIQKHTNEKKFVCTLCDYRTVNGKSLERHMKEHTMGKRLCCNICAYQGMDESALKRHMKRRTHVEVGQQAEQSNNDDKYVVENKRKKIDERCVNNVDNNLNADNNLNSVDSDLNKMDSNFNKMDISLNKVDSNLDKNDTKLDKMDSSSNKVESNLGKNDSKLDKMDSSSNKVESNLDKNDRKLNKMDSSSNKVESNLGKNDTKLDKMESSSNKVESNLDKNDSKLNKMDSNSNKVDSNLYKTDIKLNKMNSNMNKVDNSLINVEKTTNVLNGFNKIDDKNVNFDDADDDVIFIFEKVINKNVDNTNCNAGKTEIDADKKFNNIGENFSDIDKTLIVKNVSDNANNVKNDIEEIVIDDDKMVDNDGKNVDDVEKILDKNVNDEIVIDADKMAVDVVANLNDVDNNLIHVVEDVNVEKNEIYVVENMIDENVSNVDENVIYVVETSKDVRNHEKCINYAVENMNNDEKNVNDEDLSVVDETVEKDEDMIHATNAKDELEVTGASKMEEKYEITDIEKTVDSDKTAVNIPSLIVKIDLNKFTRTDAIKAAMNRGNIALKDGNSPMSTEVGNLAVSESALTADLSKTGIKNGVKSCLGELSITDVDKSAEKYEKKLVKNYTDKTLITDFDKLTIKKTVRTDKGTKNNTIKTLIEDLSRSAISKRAKVDKLPENNTLETDFGKSVITNVTKTDKGTKHIEDKPVATDFGELSITNVANTDKQTKMRIDKTMPRDFGRSKMTNVIKTGKLEKSIDKTFITDFDKSMDKLAKNIDKTLITDFDKPTLTIGNKSDEFDKTLITDFDKSANVDETKKSDLDKSAIKDDEGIVLKIDLRRLSVENFARATNKCMNKIAEPDSKRLESKDTCKLENKDELKRKKHHVGITARKFEDKAEVKDQTSKVWPGGDLKKFSEKTAIDYIFKTAKLKAKKSVKKEPAELFIDKTWLDTPWWYADGGLSYCEDDSSWNYKEGKAILACDEGSKKQALKRSVEENSDKIIKSTKLNAGITFETNGGETAMEYMGETEVKYPCKKTTWKYAGKTAVGNAWSAMDYTGSAMDYAGSAMDHAGSAMDYTGSAMDDAGSAMDHAGFTMDHAGSAMDHAGSAMDYPESAMDYAEETAWKFSGQTSNKYDDVKKHTSTTKSYADITFVTDSGETARKYAGKNMMANEVQKYRNETAPKINAEDRTASFYCTLPYKTTVPTAIKIVRKETNNTSKWKIILY